jgi:hypothetical protein
MLVKNIIIFLLIKANNQLKFQDVESIYNKVQKILIY